MSVRNKITKICYCVEDGDKDFITVNSDISVSDFMDIIKEDENNSDICAVYFHGRKLEEDDLICNHIKQPNDVLILTKDPYMMPEDFFEQNIETIQSQGQRDIENIFNDSITKANEVIKEEFGDENNFKVFTTVTSQSMIEGDNLQIKRGDDYETICNDVRRLIDQIPDNNLGTDYDIQIFLPGGVPFTTGTIEDYHNEVNFSPLRLYVVVNNNKVDQNAPVDEPCDTSGQNREILSPLVESSESGLSQIACLLGYFFHHGVHAEHLLQVLAKLTRFPPLIVNLYRLLEHAPLRASNIVSVTAPLYTYFRSLLSTESVDNNRVFEYTLNLITFLSLLDEVEYLQIRTVESENDNENEGIVRYCRETQTDSHTVVWMDDIKSPFKGYNINQTDFEKIDSILDVITTFRPVPPLSLHFIYYPAFIRGKEDNSVMLFISEVFNKKDFVRFIDPSVGKVKEIAVDVLAQLTKCDERENGIDLVDKSLVEQINVICFDQSKSMSYKLEGGICRGRTLSRAKTAAELLRAFISQSNNFRVSSLYGLIAFDDSVNVLQPITPIYSEFIEKLKAIKPHGLTHLWDAINEAKNQLMSVVTQKVDEEEEFVDDEAERVFPKASLRIIVISDGSDNKSEKDPVELANELIENGIVVDTVLVCLDDLNSQCCALSKLTGGLCFRIGSIQEGLKLFEQEAFLDISIRHRLSAPVRGHKVTKKDFDEIAKGFNSFDTSAENQEVLNARSEFLLSTPIQMRCRYKEKDPTTIRNKRALIELNNIAHNPIDNCVVYSSHATPIEWRIFFKGPEDSPFENKWLNVFMSLPEHYPLCPPKFRFLTVPFHPNVSAEGTVVFSLVGSKYNSNLRLKEIIEGLIKLMTYPEEDSPVNNQALDLYKNNIIVFEKQQPIKGEVGVDDYHEFINVKIFDVEENEKNESQEDLDDLFMKNLNSSFTPKTIQFLEDKYYYDPK